MCEPSCTESSNDYPLPAMWSSWSFGRDGSRCCLVDSWASTIGILLDWQLFASVSWKLKSFFVPFLQGIAASIGTSNFLLAFFWGFSKFSIFWINEINASQPPSVIEFWLLDCPLLLFSLLSGFSNFRPYFWPHILRSGSCLNFGESPGPHFSLGCFLFQ